MPDADPHNRASILELIEQTQRVREQTRLVLAEANSALRKADSLKFISAGQRLEWPGTE